MSVRSWVAARWTTRGASCARLLFTLCVAAVPMGCFGGPDGDVPAEGVTVRWVQNFNASELVALARHPDGVVVMDSTGSLWALSADGSLRWTVPTVGAGAYFDTALALLVTEGGVSYARLPSFDTVTVGTVTQATARSPGVLFAAIGPDGDVRGAWPSSAAPIDEGSWAVAGEVLISSASWFEGDVLQRALQAWTPGGDMLWQRTPTEPGTGARVGPRHIELRADGDDAVWAVFDTDGGCQAWQRFSVDNGEQTDAETRCEAVGLALDDGTVVRREGMDPNAALVSTDGERPWKVWLPDGYAAVPVDGAQLVLYATINGSTAKTRTGTGPLMLVDASGELRWQWPGELRDGKFVAQPSGLCRGQVAAAPDGDLYVASQACAGTRALLGATDAIFDDTHVLVARIHVYGGEPARCGNGWLDPGEVCDGQDFSLAVGQSALDTVEDGSACANFLPEAGWQGRARCTAECEVDTAPCENSCGNGQLDPGEQCDGMLRTFMEGSTCPGTRTITACVDCRYDARDCPDPPPPEQPAPACGNGQLDPGEDCDGDVFLWESPCDEYFAGEATGPALCGPDCLADISQCDVCLCTDCERPSLCP